MKATAAELPFEAKASSPTCKLVLLSLAYLSDQAGEIRAPQQELVRLTGLAERTVRAALVALTESGFVSRTGRSFRLTLSCGGGPALAPARDRQLLPAEDVHNRHLSPSTPDEDRQPPSVSTNENRQLSPVDVDQDRRLAPVSDREDRQLSPVEDGSAALRAAIEAEVGVWRAGEMLRGAVIEARSVTVQRPIAAMQLRRLACMRDREVRVAGAPAAAAGGV